MPYGRTTGFLKFKRKTRLTVDEVVSIVADNLINTTEPPVASEAFAEKEKYYGFVFRIRVFMTIIAAQHMKAKSCSHWQAVIDRIVERGRKAYSSELKWDEEALNVVEWFKQFLFNIQRDTEFERSILTAFGHKNNDGSPTSPDILVKLLLPMLRE